ncbi:MAG: GHKL domain-containing protein [Thaumarchaeota archaeon]|nr:GHKL domain-containing protein [Nitrososphaerota archaeon]
MNRRYINRDEDDKKTDALDKQDKEIFFEKDPAQNSTEKQFTNLGEDISDANKYINSLTKHIANQKSKIDSIKKMQNNFEKELGMLVPVGKPIPVQTNNTEFDILGKEFESDKIITDITEIVEKQVQNRILALESQLQEERRNSDEFKIMLEQNLKKFNNLEKNLKGQKSVLEGEVREKTERLIQAERLSAIGELASRLAHDLRNPLSAVKGTAQLIKITNKNLDEVTLKRIELIERAIFRMTHQIDGVLDYVKGTPIVKKQPTSLHETIISALQTLMIPTNVTINFPKDDIVVLCDSQKMQIVFSNIILNAIQAIGENRGTINIRAKKKQNNIEIKVEDSGSGIAPSIQGKIFDPLVTTKQEGTGLGLASCKSIIEQHRGTISATNNPTTFTITLPL